MTISASLKKKCFRIAFLIFMMFSLVFSKQIGQCVRHGLTLCARSVIPSVFPFTVLASAVIAIRPTSALPFLGKAFENIFHINRNGADVFFIGNLCGFPLGAVGTVSLVQEGYLSKEEAERLLCFSGNAGPAFVMAGIGAGLRGSFKEGVLLYFTSFLSSVTVGILLGVGKKSKKNKAEGVFLSLPRQTSFDIVSAIKNAGQSTLSVCAYVCFFTILSGSIALLPEKVSSVFLPWIEMTSASMALFSLPEPFSFCLTAFSVSFSGLCIHAQTASVISGSGLSYRPFFFAKCLQGFLSIGFAIFLSFLR